MTWSLLLLACSPPAARDSACDGDCDTAQHDDTAQVDDTATPPAGWPDPWGVLALDMGCAEGETFDEGRAQSLAQGVAGSDLVALALHGLCDAESSAALLATALASATESSWEQAALATAGSAGIALLARDALADVGSGTFDVQGADRRGYLSGTLATGVRVINADLDPDDADRREVQARQLATAALVEADPSLQLVVAADLSDGASSSAVWAFTAAGFELDTSAGTAHVLRHRAASLALSRGEPLLDGSAAWYTDGTVEDACLTWVTVEVTVDEGHFVALRGGAWPLDWNFGRPLWTGSRQSWSWVTSEMATGAFPYKALLDDETWQEGDDVEAEGCADNAVTPVWESAR